MPNMWTQTDGWDDIPFCDDPKCKIHSEDVMDANTKRILKKVAIGAGVVGVGAAAGVGAVLAAPVIIGAAGFGAAGVAAGSAAAAVQSWLGTVAAGSLFASLQSAGVLGLAATTNVAVGATAATVAAGTSGGVLLATRRNGNVKDQNTQTHKPCPDMLKKIKDHEAETSGHLVTIRIKTSTNVPKDPIKSSSIMPTSNKTGTEQMDQTQIPGCSNSRPEDTKNSDKIMSKSAKIVNYENGQVQIQECLNEPGRNYQNDGIQNDRLQESEEEASILTDGRSHSPALIEFTEDQETQTQIDEPESSVRYVPSESEADLTSDEEDTYFEMQIDDDGAANNPESISRVTQTMRRPIGMRQEDSNAIKLFW